jgi:hypothetical protein
VPVAPVIPKRVTAEIEGDFVVFLIGMRINRFWKVWQPCAETSGLDAVWTCDVPAIGIA